MSSETSRPLENIDVTLVVVALGRPLNLLVDGALPNEAMVDVNSGDRDETEIYGSLMQVERRRHCARTISRQENLEKWALTTLLGSCFGALNGIEDEILPVTNRVGHQKVTAGGWETWRS
ncbi:hypothetical protein V6N13_082518 [Hibiscus sabdariffa]|uniref:Uncharacterized protein n=1 Tax=Hibiscus sabdariffa TaxID=183260 RepID=A0ABR2Q3S9_9ROSI